MELPGIKFRPLPSELLDYLRGILQGTIHFRTPVAGGVSLVDGLMIHDYNVYAAEPWNLPRNHRSAHCAGSEAYYFTARKKKCSSSGSSMRAVRRAGAGTWKASSSKNVMSKDGSAVLGHSMQLSYVKDGATGSSGWVMDEFRLRPDPRFPEYENWAICRVKLNATTEKRIKKMRGLSALVT